MMRRARQPLLQLFVRDANKQSTNIFTCTSYFRPTSSVFTARNFSQMNTMIRQEENIEDVEEVIVKKKFITPDFYFKSREELNQIFIEAITPVIASITQEDNYTPHDIPGFILGETNLRLKVFKKTMEKFVCEIPSKDLPKIITVQDLINWFIDKVEADKPKASYKIPDNVKMFIEKHEKIRQREENRKKAFALRANKESMAMKKHKTLYGDTDLTPEQVQQIKQKL